MVHVIKEVTEGLNTEEVWKIHEDQVSEVNVGLWKNKAVFLVLAFNYVAHSDICFKHASRVQC